MLNEKELEMVTEMARIEFEAGLTDNLAKQINRKINLVEKEFDSRQFEEEERMRFLHILLGKTRKNCYPDGVGGWSEMEKCIQEKEMDDFFEAQKAKREEWQ